MLLADEHVNRQNCRGCGQTLRVLQCVRLPDLYVSNMFSSAGNRIAYQRKFKSDSHEATRAQFQRHARGNTLFENVGDGTFRDVSVSSAVTMGRWAWGSTFIDLNNDGLEDIFVANGYVTQEDTGDL